MRCTAFWMKLFSRYQPRRNHHLEGNYHRRFPNCYQHWVGQKLTSVIIRRLSRFEFLLCQCFSLLVIWQGGCTEFKRSCESLVPRPRTQHNVPGQYSHLDCSIWGRSRKPPGHCASTCLLQGSPLSCRVSHRSRRAHQVN